ncbi:MAG: inorganic diphosphatase [Deltaproteobacteria bacterium]|nr:inorganic diphosphatase [Deltaproteobacteria bacterium]MCW5802393.1 inorganic diphosphatase [Deltaproteobacteria bacterium]
MHPVHDIEVPADIAAFVPAVVEIPRGSHLKYEIDKPTGLLRLDRVLYSAVFYPANYGFIPRTHADDGDPLDILVLMQEPVEPLTIVRCRPLGGMRMVDEHGGDDKIIGVCIDDPAYAHYRTVKALPPHILVELDRFFRDYKVLEGKQEHVDVGAMYDLEEALEVIDRSRSAYDRGEGR